MSTETKNQTKTTTPTTAMTDDEMICELTNLINHDLYHRAYSDRLYVSIEDGLVHAKPSGGVWSSLSGDLISEWRIKYFEELVEDKCPSFLPIRKSLGWNPGMSLRERMEIMIIAIRMS
jgi:hypothetical protein